jgi:hypothetical protein
VSRCWRIAAQIPSPEIGAGYFQETHPQMLFPECNHYCELVSESQQLPRILEIAIREAVGKRGVAVADDGPVLIDAVVKSNGTRDAALDHARKDLAKTNLWRRVDWPWRLRHRPFSPCSC